jgi:hypothetical protein
MALHNILRGIHQQIQLNDTFDQVMVYGQFRGLAKPTQQILHQL